MQKRRVAFPINTPSSKRCRFETEEVDLQCKLERLAELEAMIEAGQLIPVSSLPDFEMQLRNAYESGIQRGRQMSSLPATDFSSSYIQ